MSNEEILECPTVARYVNFPVEEIPEKIIKTVADFFDIPEEKLTGASKKGVYKYRSYAVFFIWKYTDLKQREVAEYFKGNSKSGYKDRTIVVHARGKIFKKIKEDFEIKTEFLALTSLIESAIHS